MKRSRSHEEDEKADMKKMKKRSRSAVQQAQDALHELQAMRKKPENARWLGDRTPASNAGNNVSTLFDLAASQMASTSSGTFKIMIQPQTGKEFLLDVKASDTIKKVKAKIQKQSSSSIQEGIPPKEQTLIREQDDMTLEDRHTLSKYNIQPSSKLSLIWNEDNEDVNEGD